MSALGQKRTLRRVEPMSALPPPVAAKAIPAAHQKQLKAAVPGPRQTAAETMQPANDPVNQTSSARADTRNYRR